jgi:IS1 family transposase
VASTPSAAAKARGRAPGGAWRVCPSACGCEARTGSGRSRRYRVALGLERRLLRLIGQGAWPRYGVAIIRLEGRGAVGNGGNAGGVSAWLDEIWAFCYAKQRNGPFAKKPPEEAGDIWTWVAIDAETKLIPSWRIGDRSGATAVEFVCDLSRRLANRVQITSDGHRAYLEAVEAGFGADVDYAQLVKLYGEVPHPAGRYSPAQIQGTKTFCCTGDPDPKHISTSYVERQNLTMRMSMRRFTRLSNGFSKKAENHAHSVAIHFMHYNFVRIHQSLRVTPAMAAGVTSKLWSITDMVRVIEEREDLRSGALLVE